MLTHKIQRHPIAVAMVVLAGVAASAFMLERMNLRNQQVRVEEGLTAPAAQTADEESMEKILHAPTSYGVFKFYDAQNNAVCWVFINRYDTAAISCLPLSGTTDNAGIESIPMPKKRDKWGA